MFEEMNYWMYFARLKEKGLKTKLILICKQDS